ncbi:MAG: hypothetical protein Kow001_00080 [Acidobacteriota bacterium]
MSRNRLQRILVFSLAVAVLAFAGMWAHEARAELAGWLDETEHQHPESGYHFCSPGAAPHHCIHSTAIGPVVAPPLVASVASCETLLDLRQRRGEPFSPEHVQPRGPPESGI